MQVGTTEIDATPTRAEGLQRIVCEGPFLRTGTGRFVVKGVTYGTFGHTHTDLLPDLKQVERDFAAVAAAGFNTVRTYTEPRPEILDLAGEHALRLLVGLWWQDPLYAGPQTAATWREMARRARAEVRAAAARCGGHPAVLGLVVGNEIPSGAVRWYGPRRVERLLAELYESGKGGEPDCLLGYANYPTTGYLDTGCFDFDCLNVFLEDERAFRRYLAQQRATRAERPLVLTEIGLDARAHGEHRQAEVLDWQLRAAYEFGVAGTCLFSWTDEWWVAGDRVDDWGFGITRADRSSKPALATVAQRHRAGLLGCRERWPRVSVVVCAYQAEATLGECLASLPRLTYPDYEVIVVDDGSTDATAAIASAYPVRLLADGHRGLSAARNLGLEHATGDVVAYIDADARADPDWLSLLVLALHRPGAAAAGGPNLVPPEDPPVAQAISRAPGGPIHVLFDDEYAEHVPGCNMAFWRERLREIGGFDSAYRTAGDDADVCWKLLDLGHRIAFHPAALVWHHPRARVRGFWRQQVGYGRAEALLARRHAERFTGTGRARWRGVVYGPVSPLRTRRRLYAGRFGQAPYQRLYGGAPVSLQVALNVIAVCAVLALVAPPLAVLPLVALLSLAAAALGVGLAAARRHHLRPALRSALLVGVLHVVQPIAREVGRLRVRRGTPELPGLPTGVFPPARRPRRGLFAVDGVTEDQRAALLLELRGRLAGAGLRVELGSVWGHTDLTCRSLLWEGRLRSYAVADATYVRLARRPQAGALLAAAVVALGAATWGPLVGAVGAAALAAVAGADAARLSYRVRHALAGDARR